MKPLSCLVFGVALATLAQTPGSGDSGMASGRMTKLKLVPSSDYEVQLPSSGPVLVGLLPTSPDKIHVALSNIVVKRLGRDDSAAVVDRLRDGVTDLRITGTTIEVFPGLPQEERLLIVGIPKGVSIRVLRPGISPMSLTVTAPLLIDGSEVMSAPESEGHLVNRGMARILSRSQKPVAAISLTPAGTYLVSPAYLRQNSLAVTANFLMSREVDARCCRPLPLVRITIGEDGKVVEVKSLSGDAAVTDPLQTEAMQWRFRPFVHAGRSVVVEALVGVARNEAGALQLTF